MEKKTTKELEALMKEIRCEKGFKCCSAGSEDVCRVTDIGLDDYLLCLEEKPQRCEFVVPFGDEYMCRCPVRLYLMKELGR